MVVTVFETGLKFSSRNGGPNLDHSNFLHGIETEIEIGILKIQRKPEIVLGSIKPGNNGSPKDRTSVIVMFMKAL